MVNQLPKLNMSASTTGCCAPFDPNEWDKKTFVFDNKLFVTFTTRNLFHMPLNMGSATKEAMAKVDAVAACDKDAYCMLSDETSPWKGQHYIAVNKEVPGAAMARLSGTYITKVFEGPFKNAGTWYAQLIEYAASNNKKPLKTYFYYTTCPKCAKAYGKNYVVGFAQVG